MHVSPLKKHTDLECAVGHNTHDIHSHTFTVADTFLVFLKNFIQINKIIYNYHMFSINKKS